MATLVEDARKSATWIASALSSSAYNADFSLESLREIDRFFDEHTRDGQAIPGGLLSEQFGLRIFALGAYVGEVLIRTYGGQWQADDSDSESELNMQVIFPNGTVVWPVQRIMKRFRNGAEDGIYAYGRLVG